MRSGRSRSKATNVWQEFAAEITIPDGKQALYFVYRGGSEPLMLKSFALLNE